MAEIILVDENGIIFYKGENEFHDVAEAIEEQLALLGYDDIQKHYGIDMKDEIENVKNEALTSRDTFTQEEAEKITMDEFDKLGLHHDSFTERMKEFYYDIHHKFIQK